MSFERASLNFISAGMSPDYSNLLAAKTPKPSGIRDSLLGYAESNGKTWHQEVAEFAVSEYGRQTAVTRPTLPPKKIVEGGGVSVEHYYRSNDHPPAHAHVIGGGKTTRIGPNGKPLAGDPELTPIQRRLVDENKSRIRRNVNKIGRWLDFGD